MPTLWHNGLGTHWLSIMSTRPRLRHRNSIACVLLNLIQQMHKRKKELESFSPNINKRFECFYLLSAAFTTQLIETRLEKYLSSIIQWSWCVKKVHWKCNSSRRNKAEVYFESIQLNQLFYWLCYPLYSLFALHVTNASEQMQFRLVTFLLCGGMFIERKFT